MSCIICRLFTFIVTLVSLPLAGYAGQARTGGGAARFEVTSLRAVRPILVKTIADLEKKNAAAAKTDMEDYDSAWNGVEVYVSTRSMDLYNEIEHHYQTAVTEALNKPNPDTTAILADAKAMLARHATKCSHWSRSRRRSIACTTTWRACGSSAPTCAK